MLQRNDILWKGILEDLFADFLRFFYTNADEIFDIDRGFEFLDKELEQLYPGTDLKHPKFVDKLVKVFAKSGKEEWLLIHVEVQGYDDGNFTNRMFTYFYRIRDRFGKEVSSIAIFTDKDVGYCPDTYEYNLLGTSIRFQFRTYKILEQDKEELEQRDNPFAIVILTVLLALEKEEHDDEELVKLSIDIARRMYRKGFERAKIKQLLFFLKSYVNFEKPEINSKFDDEIDKLNNKTHTMGIIEQVQQMRIDEGIEKTKISIVKNLLLNSEHTFTLQEIANITEVSLDFVLEVKKQLESE